MDSRFKKAAQQMDKNNQKIKNRPPKRNRNNFQQERAGFNETLLAEKLSSLRLHDLDSALDMNLQQFSDNSFKSNRGVSNVQRNLKKNQFTKLNKNRSPFLFHDKLSSNNSPNSAIKRNHQSDDLLQSQCSSRRSSLSSIIADQGEKQLNRSKRNMHYERNRYKNGNLLHSQCSSIKSSLSSLISDKDDNKFNMSRNKTYYENDRYKNDNLLKSQCSSRRSSFSSIVSDEEENQFNKSRRNNYYERNAAITTFSNHYIFGLMKKNDDLIIKSLLKNKLGYKNLFCTHKNVRDMTVIFQLLSRIGNISDQTNKEYLLSLTLNEQFIENMCDYIPCILLGNDKELVKELCQLQKFYSDIIHIIPPEKLESFNELFLNSLSKMEKIANVPDSLLNEMKDIVAITSEKLESAKNQFDVTNLSVLPTTEDLTEVPELKPNLVKGTYENPSNYLSIHFKLLKEDFLSGLRSGLHEYIESIKSKSIIRFKDIFLYDAIYCGFVNRSKKNNMALSFEIDNKKLKKVDWATSKRLIHGSLLLISNDNFKTFYFAFLDDRKTPKNEDKTFIISATITEKFINLKKYSKCVIMEPRVFFEPYFQVLKTMKKINPNIFPMEKYIVEVNTDVSPPVYVNKETNYMIKGNEINIFDINSSEYIGNLGLNDSQRSALQAGLTKELVLIQGPPGTGKTYLGLQIINILLENKLTWKTEESPILIICYRNHAVDQILESLINGGKNVVRLGSQSSNEIVKPMCIRAAVNNVNTNLVLRDQINVKKTEINHKKYQISQLQALITCVNEKKGILSLEALDELFNEKHVQYFSSSNAYEEWLFGGFDENDDLQKTNEIFLEDVLLNEQNENTLFNIRSFLLLNTWDLKNEILDLKNTINNFYLQMDPSNLLPDDVLKRLVELLQLDYEKEAFFKKFLNRMNLNDNNIDPSNINNINLSDLTISERWSIYQYWADRFCTKCQKKIEELFILVQEDINTLEELNVISDGHKVRQLDPDVVGATTTGAARLSSLLSVIKPKIVIFEEAAEVLEAHTITALTQFCEHIIMIGDHQQLRPNPASMMSVHKYKLDISLFERMINNNMEYFTLNEQHRMRPLISSLVIPQFYPNLKNHKDVENYPDVRGLKTNMFFVNHTIPEDEMLDSDSQRNKHEAHFILALADYILKQGYEKKEITILTFYGAQLHYLKAVRSKYDSLKGVSIEVVDNFQGEENKIVLLSIVRSNSHSIGFLSKMNRICVALTRAREGFYLIGNMTTLKDNSLVWKGIDETLRENCIIGDELPLKCSTHGNVTMVSTSQNFEPLIFGGCTKKCDIRLECGHTCDLQCHGTDDSHMGKYSCRKPCERKRPCNIHDCDVACGIVPCPKCDVILETELPCGHMGSKICEGSFLPCPSNCSVPLPCGHPCSKECHFPQEHQSEVCTYPCGIPNKNCELGHKCVKPCGYECGECIVKTFITLPCGHIAKVICNLVKKTICKVPVKKILDCGHTVKAECSKPISEVKCTEIVEEILKCGHKINVPCERNLLDELLCENIINKSLPCGHIKKIPCYLSDKENIFCDELIQKKLDCMHCFKLAECSTPPEDINCEEMVIKTAKCGHDVEVMCHQSSGPVLCNQPCTIKKPCGHKCSGLCGHPCPQECSELIETLQACGHLGNFPCSPPQTVKENCSDAITTDDTLSSFKCETLCKTKLKCGHECAGTCGECMQGSVHEACLEPCRQLLMCGHRCSNSCSLSIHLCNNNCLNRCRHQTCKHPCGEPCRKCRKKCEWKCEHFECTQMCWEDCNRKPCTAPCKKLLTCGHTCNGFCGEPCPTICFICTPNKYTEKKYILLEDCGHEMSQNEILSSTMNNIGLFLCPVCQTPATVSYYIRYYSKNWFKLSPRIKGKIFSKYNNVNALTRDLKYSLRNIYKLLKMNETFKGFIQIKLLLEGIVKETKMITFKEKEWNNVEKLRSLVFISYYIFEIFHMLKESNLTDDKHLVLRINKLSFYLNKHNLNISRTQICELKNELDRMSLLCNLSKFRNETNLDADPIKKKSFEEAWELANVIKQFNDNEKNNLITFISKINSNISMDTRLMKSKFLLNIENFFQITTHKHDWTICKEQGHIYYNIGSTNLQSNCPTCANRKHEFLL